MDLGVAAGTVSFLQPETSNSVRILMGMVGLAFITCLSAYLFDLQYSLFIGFRKYPLLRPQTVGMTGTQVKNLMKRQMRWIGIFGIGGGLLREC